MKAALLSIVLWPVVAIAAAEPPAVAECTPEQSDVEAAPYKQIAAHRLVPLPSIEYAGGEEPASGWGLQVELRVDESGRVQCYRLGSQYGETAELNPQRRAWLQTLDTLRYRPFPDAASPRPMLVTEYVREGAATERLRPLPIVPLQQVSLTLERSGCYGTCPSYTVEIRGDGRVTYTGRGLVDVVGEHTYAIPVADVQQLVDTLRDKDIWSSKTEYSASITDNPSYRLTIVMGAQTHGIHDYVGAMVGMPAAITEFENAIDAAAHSARWIRLSTGTIAMLDAEGFDYASPAAGAMLWRAAAHEDGDDEAALQLLDRGVRTDGTAPDDLQWSERGSASVLATALRNRRFVLADALIAAGALLTDGRQDQARVDAAFRAAITSGRLAAVQMVWSAAGDTPPALAYDDVFDDVTRHVPVTLLLEAPYDRSPWEGLQIAQWLAARGCDLHAAGADDRTLLHIAADAGDVEFVRHLLKRGVDPSARGRYGWRPLRGTGSEDVALLLLEAGADSRRLSDEGESLRERAEARHWQRVVAWIDARER